MNITVCAKQIPDPANEITYDNGLISRPEEQVLDDTDRYGIEIALQLKEKYDARSLLSLWDLLELKRDYSKHYRWVLIKLFM